MDSALGRPPTIIDIAQATGLSKSVVSRALNGEPGVSAKSRLVVLEAAAQLGYVANAMAQKMRSQQVDTVGVLVRDPASPFYGALLGSLQATASEQGIRLITMTGSGRADLEEERAALRSLLALRVDGLLVCSGLMPASDLYAFADRVPTVVVGRSESDARIGSVAGDEEAGASLLVDHVVGGGSKRLVVPIVPSSAAPTLHARGELFMARARTFGIDPIPLSVETPAQAIDALSARSLDATAILAPNDRWAVALLERFGKRSDLVVTGYDGVGVYTSPLLGLTTVVQPVQTIAAAALGMVVEILTTSRHPEHLLFPGVLHVA